MNPAIFEKMYFRLVELVFGGEHDRETSTEIREIMKQEFGGVDAAAFADEMRAASPVGIRLDEMAAALETLAKPENLDEQATLQEGNEEA